MNTRIVSNHYDDEFEVSKYGISVRNSGSIRATFSFLEDKGKIDEIINALEEIKKEL